MTAKSQRKQDLKSLHNVREFRVRIHEAALATAERKLSLAWAELLACEHRVQQAMLERQRYERDVFDRMAFEPQQQVTLRDAMIRLKALGVEIETRQEAQEAAKAEVDTCTEQREVARQSLSETAKGELKVAELIRQQKESELRLAEIKDEDPS